MGKRQDVELIMEKSVDRELEAILNLIQLTQTGVIQWESAKPWGDLKDDECIRYVSVMCCDYTDRMLRLYVERKRIDKPGADSVALTYFYGERTFPFWEERPVLEITNGEGQSLWRFPNKSAVRDLLKAAKYQVAGVKEILDSLTSKPV